MEPLLSVRGLRVETAAPGRRETLLRDIAFDIGPGESFALLGESGSGKSLTALSILRLLPDGLRVRGGAVRLHGRNLLRRPEMAMREVRGGSIGMIFQEPMTSLNPVLTAGRQLTEALGLHRGARGRDARRTALQLLGEVGIDDAERVFASHPHELSGGMKQRVMIAAALAGEPELLIADEPTTALDVTIQAQVLDLLKKLQADRGMAMLFISHDLSVVSSIAGRIAVMRDGEILEQAGAGEFFSRARHDYSRRLCTMLPGRDKRGLSLFDGARLPPPQGGEPLAEVRNLAVHFPVRKGVFKRTVGHIKAVDGVSFALRRGRTLALVGESGSGKTTIARALLGLVEPTAGELRLEQPGGAARGAGNAWQRLRRRAQIVFQDPFSSLNPKMQVEQLVGEGLRARHAARGGALRERVAALLAQVGLSPDCMHRHPHQFSGGQRQRICIARALAVEPELIIWDEPTSALDVSVQARILDLFLRLQADLGLSYLFITHDISVVAYMAHEVAVVYRGRIVEQGQTEPLLDAPGHRYTRELLSAVPALPAFAA
ncbi:MAG: ABC transporter ATP-binding protein [Gammaproteobacteria bacterium]|nr:ABC transporter ATP-binding protein [Gammaproteobacteria bacterium]